MVKLDHQRIRSLFFVVNSVLVLFKPDLYGGLNIKGRFAFPEANAQIIAALQRRFQAESDAPAA